MIDYREVDNPLIDRTDYVWSPTTRWTVPKNTVDCSGWIKGTRLTKNWNVIYDRYSESLNKTYDEILKHIAKIPIKEKVEINESDIINLLKDDN